MSFSVGPVMIAERFARLPLDMVELNPLNNDEYELIIDSLPVRLDKSSCTKLETEPIAPPLPPPPQAVKVDAITLESNMFLIFLTAIDYPLKMHPLQKKMRIWLLLKFS
jgi:hypothetical protein